MFLNIFVWVPEFTSTTAPWEARLIGNAKHQGRIGFPVSFRQLCPGQHGLSCRPISPCANLSSHFFENDLAFLISEEVNSALENV